MSRLLPLLLLGSGALASPPQEVEVYRFEVEVQTVYVDVFVTHGGKSVPGLNADDFQVFDSGVPQEIDLVNPEVMSMSIMLLLDTSGSMVGEKLEHLRTAAHAFIEGLRGVDEAGLLTFSYQWQRLTGPSHDFRILHKALDRSVISGPTGFYDALYAGLKLVEERPGRPLVVLFTDGYDNASWLTESQLLDVVKASDAVVHIVGIQSAGGVFVNRAFDPTSVRFPFSGRSPDNTDKAHHLLQTIAKASGGRVWFAESSDALKDVYLSVLEDMESRYLLSYQPRGVDEPGWHPLEVKLRKGKKGTLRAREGYTVTESR